MHKILEHKKVLFAVIGLVVIIGLGVVLSKPKEEMEEDIIWREYPVTYNDVTASLDGGGTLEASGVRHSSDVDLKIEKLMVEVGDEVKKGDVLATYDLEALQKKVKELETSLGTAQRALEDARNNKLRSRLQNEMTSKEAEQNAQNDYESQKKEAQTALNSSEKTNQQLEELLGEQKKELKKLKKELTKLKKNNSVSQNDAKGSGRKAESQGVDDIQQKITTLTEQIKQTETEIKTAQSDMENNQNSLNDLNSDYEKQTAQDKEKQKEQGKIDALTDASMDNVIANAKAEAGKIRDELREAEEALNNPSLTAEIDGIVIEVSYTEGDDVPEDKSIVTVGNSSEKLVVTQISQEDIGSVEVGQEVEMQFSANPDTTVKGKVYKKSLAPTQGGEDVNYKVTIAFDELQEELLQGMTCSIKFILKRVENVLTLSNKAITLRDGKQIVNVLLPDGSREEREIQTGFSDGRVSEIKSGLADGEIVVIEG